MALTSGSLRLAIPLVLLLSLALSLLQAPAAPAQAVTCEIADVIDDGDPAVTYTGTWLSYASGADVCGTHVVGRTVRATMTMPFTGDRAQVIGYTARNLGMADVALDGELVATINTYGGSTVADQVLFDTGDLVAGEHELTITMTGERDERAVGSYIAVDALVMRSQLRFEYDTDLPDEALFDAIDLNRPGLEGVRSAVEAGDLAAARQALVDYFAARTAPVALSRNGDLPESYDGFDRTAADQLVNGVSYTRGTARTPPITGYQPHLLELADAYWWTGDSKYAVSLAGQLQRTAREAFSIRGTNILNAALQVPNWIASWQALRTAEEFTTDQSIDVLKALLARGRWLDKNIVLKPGALTYNITWMTAASAAHLGIMFPEFAEADRWRDRGLAGMELSLIQDVYPDGATKELAPSYHGIYPQYLLGTLLLLQKNDLDVGVLESPAARWMTEYLMFVVKPDGSIPALNDSDTFLAQQMLGGGEAYLEQTGIAELEAIAADDPAHHSVSAQPRELLEIGAEVFDDPEMAWVASGGTHGVEPAAASRGLEYAGQAFQRTGWDAQDLYLVLDAGPYGRAHQHEDKLAIDMMAYGRNLVVDPGRYTYVTTNPYRQYFYSSAAHSTVLVDGEGQGRRGLPDEYETEEPLTDFTWRSDRVFDDASGRYDAGYGATRDKSVTHGREVFFAKDEGYWIVTDRMTGTREATTQTQFQLTPGDVQLAADRPALTFVTDDEEGLPSAGLLIDSGSGDAAALTVAEGQEEPISGWYAPRMQFKYPAPMVTFERAGALPRTDSTLLYPFAGTDAPEVTSVRVEVTTAEGAPLQPGSASAVRIKRPDATDLFLSSSTPGELAAFDGSRSDGSRAWLSRSLSGDLQAFVLVEGTTLDGSGGSVVVESEEPVSQLSGRVNGTVLRLEGGDLPERLRVGAPTRVTEVQVNGVPVGFTRQGDTLQVWTTLSVEPLDCTTTVTGTHEGPINVTAGQAVCVAPGTTVDGPVRVLAGGAFSSESAHILGPVFAKDAGTLRLINTQTDGATSIDGTRYGVLLAGSSFEGRLSCNNNLPAVVDNGRPITVNGTVRGQCRSLVEPQG